MAESGSERAALLPSNPALSGEGDRQGGRRVIFSHTHPRLLFPRPSARSLLRKLSVPGGGRGRGRPRPAVKNTQRPPPTLWRGRPAAPRGAAAPQPPLPPFAFPSSAPMLLKRLQSLPLLLLFLIGSSRCWSEREGRQQCERKLEGGLRGDRETAENGA